MKTKTILLSLFSLCLFFAFSATPAQAADDWGGYKLIGENRAISIYAKVENKKGVWWGKETKKSTVWWRVVNHTDQWLVISFKPVYHFDDGKNVTGYQSEELIPKMISSHVGGPYSTLSASDHHVIGIEIFEVKIDENPLTRK